MTRSLFLALVAVLGVDATAFAQSEAPDSSVFQRIVRKLETANKDCTVGVSFVGRMMTSVRGSPSNFDSALLLIYTVESCM